ncbi:MAG: hypothetical protein IJT76_00915 [Clostridia bacterium]|nr:hypothetical protein [Clostridia bacterium]
MNKTLFFAILEGDRRQNVLYELLTADGYEAQILPDCDRWKEENLPPPGAILIAASASSALRREAGREGFRLLEYGSLPSFQKENGVITAEGAIQLAMKHRLRILRGSRALVIGWGNIGKPLAAMLRALDVTVGVAVRREEQLWHIRAEGYRPVFSAALEQEAGDYDLIFNTAPAMVLPEVVLEQVHPRTLVIDLASRPGGVDRQAAERLGIKCVQALGLPGLLTPVSGAIAIRSAIEQLLKEEQDER